MSRMSVDSILLLTSCFYLLHYYLGDYFATSQYYIKQSLSPRFFDFRSRDPKNEVIDVPGILVSLYRSCDLKISIVLI